jgi:hypothetical protein
MGYRVFRDSQGVRWQAWDVIPQLAERRVGDRRRPPAVPSNSERRRAVDRRVIIGRRPVLSAGLDGGWLCFEAPVGKRRLTPIPDDWQECNEMRLEEYCRRARLANRMSSALHVSDT